jgi:hypothetical protein
MRIWMLASLFAVTAIGGDRGMESSSQFFDRVIASSSRLDPFTEVQLWHAYEGLQNIHGRVTRMLSPGQSGAIESATTLEH